MSNIGKSDFMMKSKSCVFDTRMTIIILYLIISQPIMYTSLTASLLPYCTLDYLQVFLEAPIISRNGASSKVPHKNNKEASNRVKKTIIKEIFRIIVFYARRLE